MTQTHPATRVAIITAMIINEWSNVNAVDPEKLCAIAEVEDEILSHHDIRFHYQNALLAAKLIAASTGLRVPKLGN